MMTEWLVMAGLLVASPGQDTVPVLDLATVVGSALETHPRVAGAGARLAAATAAAGEARAARLPTVSAALTATQHEKPMVVAPLHGFDPGSLPEFDETLYQGHATATYTLFDGGARGARVRAGEALADAASAGLELARDAVIADAVSAYTGALATRDVRRAHREQVRALESELERSRLMLREGKAARVAVLRTQAALSRARAELETAEESVRLALRRLARVSGLPDERVLEAELVDVAPRPEPIPDRPALVAEARAASPRLERAEREARAAEARVSAARSSYYPRLELSGRYSAFGSPETDPAPEWQAGVQVSYPLFTGGARSQAVARAEAEAAGANAGARLEAQEVADAVDRALLAYRSASARADALEAAVSQSEEVARIEALALQQGAGVQTDYLQAEAELLLARAGLAEARYGVVEARVRLAQATGELTESWILRMTEGVER